MRIVEVSGQTVRRDRLSALGTEHEVTGPRERVRPIHVEVRGGQMGEGVIDSHRGQEGEWSGGDGGLDRELRGQLFEEEGLELAPRTREAQIRIWG